MLRRTVIFPEPSRVELVDEPVPPLREGTVLIETRRTLISSGTEGTIFRGRFAEGSHWHARVKYPYSPGYLNAGRVVAIGKGVEGFKEGDRVSCRGGHTSHAIALASRVVRIPENVPDDFACWAGLGKITQIAVRAAEHRLGDDVVVVGPGVLGQLIIQYAQLLGARVLAVGRSAARLAIAERHGAIPVRAPIHEAKAAVLELTEGRGADVVYDATGNAEVLSQALTLARRLGTVVLVGDTGAPATQLLGSEILNNGLRVIGAHDAHASETPSDQVRWTAQRMNALFMRYLSGGQLRLDQLVTHHFPPGSAAEAYAMTERHEAALGVVFDWDAPG